MKKLSIILVALLVLTSFVTAQWKWVSVDGESKRPTPIEVKLLSATAKEIKLEVKVPGYLERKVKLPDGTEVVMIHIPETARTMERGFPMLPLFAKAIKLHERCDVELKLIEKQEVEFKLELPVIPSKGHFTRDIPEQDVSFEFGPVYKQDVFWPGEKEQFQLGKTFFLRETRGAVLKVLPIRANHVQKVLKVVSKATLVVVCEGEQDMVMMSNEYRRPSKTFQNLTSDFIGYEEQVLRGDVPTENVKKLVVVVPTQFRDAINNWVAWKQKNGYTVTVKEVSSGVKAQDIKTYLQGLYDNTATRFGYVVLIGDAAYVSDFTVAQPMPTFKGKKEGAAADREYVRLAGADNYPDAFISRISAKDATNVAQQLDKVVHYAMSTAAGDWLTKGITIASNEGSPADYTRADWLINGGGTGQKVPVLTGGLKGFGYTYFDRVYAPSASASTVANGVNDGRGIICYIGHGSSTSWVTSGFNNTNVNSLSNGSKLPVIWSVACVNGDFVKQDACFGEAWLRKVGGGAVGMECASTNESWVPPCDKQAATINAIITKKYNTFGALECEGLVAALKNWGDTDSSEGNKLAEQCHLFGDCSMLVRTTKPLAIQANTQRGLDSNVIFNISSEDRAVADATVTVYNSDFSIMVTAETSEEGQVNIVLPTEANNVQLFYTVVGQDLLPIVDQPLN